MAREVLHVLEGPAAGSRLSVAEPLELGRDAAEPERLGGDERISRRHARFSRDASGGLVIEDLGSTNGTRVNDEAVLGARALHPGDRVGVGRSVLELRIDGETDGASAPAEPPPPSGPPPTIEPPTEESTRSGVLAPTAELLHGGRRLPIPVGGATVGRSRDNDVEIASPRASRRHARIAPGDGGHVVADLDSGNGTYLNGERLHGESRRLEAGDTITVGGEQLRYVTGQRTSLGAPASAIPARDVRRIDFAGERVRIGRDPGNELVLDDPNVSRFHAEVVPREGGLEVRDLGSRNGTRVDGAPASTAQLEPGAQIVVGPYRLIFDGTGLVARDDHGALRLDAEDVTVRIKGREILKAASLSVEPGELVVIIGESGSGKSTLVKALAGVNSPSEGTVSVNGEPVGGRLTDIGYVPQDEIVHTRLTVREALRYAARLRLPHDSTRADLDAAVERVLGEVSLVEHAETQIGSLSGGQRKRAGVAVELLSRPSLLFLDEPTSGLDPELESRLMELFRQLASEGARAVVLVTHATRNLRLCDRLVVMGRGGDLCFSGSPGEALRFFGAEDYDEIYTRLDDRPAVEWRREFEARHRRPTAEAADGSAPAPTAPAGAGAEASGARRVRGLTQARVLVGRYARLFVRDRRNLAILLGQAPLIALGIALLFQTGLFDRPRGQPAQAVQLLFLLAVTAIWLGAIDASREIVKERAITARERAIGVRVRAYLASKVVVLLAVVSLQTALLVAVVLVAHPLRAGAAAYVEVASVVLLAGFAAIGMGLLVSALVRSEDQATSFIPLTLIPQLLFAGAIVPVAKMSGAIALLSNLVFARWALAGAGTAIDTNGRLAADRTTATASGYGRDFFDVGAPTSQLVLLAFLGILLAGVAVALRRSRD